MTRRHNKDNYDRFFDYGLHLETRTIYIGEIEDAGVGPAMAEFAVKALHLFSTTPDLPIRIILNTNGGDWYCGMAIYDAIRASPCHVVVEVLGAAMSMGSIILQAGDERVMHPNSCLMIHDGAEGFDGHCRNFEAWGAWATKLRKRMYELYAEKSGKDVNYWQKRCMVDFIMTPEQAIAEGLADRIEAPVV